MTTDRQIDDRFDQVVVGGGFYGVVLAEQYASQNPDAKVCLLESESTLMSRASFFNQARVHKGYHYPRSLLTAYRSMYNSKAFLEMYADCIDDRFTMLYAISSKMSNVSAQQFFRFCKMIGAPISPAKPEQYKLFERGMIDQVFAVEEFAFDAAKLRQITEERLAKCNVEIKLETVAQKFARDESGISIYCLHHGNDITLHSKRVLCCGYTQTNDLMTRSGLELLDLDHELAEMPLVEVSPALQNIGITVMCGPFFSLMPFPARDCYSLSHVRYTPHFRWSAHKVPEGLEIASRASLDEFVADRPSHFRHMIADGSRYLPELANSKLLSSMWEVKTILPQCEQDDSRPILLSRDHGGLNGLDVVIGSKIDNVFDTYSEDLTA